MMSSAVFGRLRLGAAFFGLVLLAGCAVQPRGPSVMALPGSTKSFEQFRADDAECRQFARQRNNGATSGQAATDAGLRSAAVGTAIGAVAGAALGGHEAAGAGAGVGLIVGGMAGAGAAQQGAQITQNQYDQAYIQCMYGRGQKVPVPASSIRAPARAEAPAAPPAPPPYLPPPPPPR